MWAVQRGPCIQIPDADFKSLALSISFCTYPNADEIKKKIGAVH
jgi:hypothetical protein